METTVSTSFQHGIQVVYLQGYSSWNFLPIQPTFTCSKLTMETPEQCVKPAQSYLMYQVFGRDN